MRKLALLVVAALVLAAPGPIDPHSAHLLDGETISIQAEPLPLPSDNAKLGLLRPVAALELTSKDVRFGGWSALEVRNGGDVVLLSDRAFVLHGRIVQNKDGVVTGLADARIGALRNNEGAQYGLLWGDSEGLARLRNGLHVVSLELKPRLEFYDFDKQGEKARPMHGPPLAGLDKLARNQELEALTVLADGSILAGSERGFAGGDESLLWRAPPNANPDGPPIEPAAKIKLPDGFSLTDLAGAPDGSFYALFRSYLPILGARGQIWRFHFVETNGDTQVHGEKIAALEAPFPVDNYEGLALSLAPNGGQRLFVISDDNYRFEQRTILLAFDITEKAPETGASPKFKSKKRSAN